MSFCSLGLGPETLKALAEVGYTTPTPIQAQAIPVVFMGKDVLGIAQTGTGKTASFTLPMIEILAQGRTRARMPRALLLTPTRELAAQVAKSFARYGCYHSLSMALLVGGESVTAQIRLLDRGVDVLIATPGRLLDLFQRGHVLLSDVRILVIDEADRMLDMGFIPDVERIVTLLPRRRQTLFFSATMPSEVKRLADLFLNEPREIHAAPPAQPADGVVQALVVVNSHAKDEVLRYFLRKEEVRSAFIFCNRKRDICVLHRSLIKHGFPAGMLHGDLLQSLRTDTLEQFRSGEISLLVCSDVAARGIDITALSHVFNFDVPIHAEDYIHRIGRTGRAGMSGHALTIAVPEDSHYVVAIEKLIGHQIPRVMVDDDDMDDDLDEVAGVSEHRKRMQKANRTCVGVKRKKDTSKERQNKLTEQLIQDYLIERSQNTGVLTMEHSEDVLGFGDHVPAFFLVNALEHQAKVSDSSHHAVRKAVSVTRAGPNATRMNGGRGGRAAGERAAVVSGRKTTAAASSAEEVASAEEVVTEHQEHHASTEPPGTAAAAAAAGDSSDSVPSETAVSQKKRGRPSKRKGMISDTAAGTATAKSPPTIKRGRPVSRKTTGSHESRATTTRRRRQTPPPEGMTEESVDTAVAPALTRRTTKAAAPDRTKLGKKGSHSHESAVIAPKILGDQTDPSPEKAVP